MLAMSLLLPLSFLFVLLIGAALWWAIFSGQFDDVQRHGESILDDDDSGQSDSGRPGDSGKQPPGGTE